MDVKLTLVVRDGAVLAPAESGGCDAFTAAGKCLADLRSAPCFAPSSAFSPH